MTLSNQERKEIIEQFASMYAATDDVSMLSHMPQDTNDPEALSFENYFNFLQDLYGLRSDIKSISEEELDGKIQDLAKRAEEFNYPVNILGAFYG